jgi:hypothetical protein
VPHDTEKIVCRFIGDFKVGDNLVRNANSLCRLDTTNDAGIFNKLIVVQAGSITEAALQQIIYRAQNFNREGVVNIPEEDRLAIAKKEIEKFAVIIDVLKKHKILDALGEGVYEELHKLREYRNKVHIQLDVEGASRDENIAFSDAICTWALKFMVRVLKHLNEVYPRPEDLARYATPLVVPSPR